MQIGNEFRGLPIAARMLVATVSDQEEDYCMRELHRALPADIKAVRSSAVDAGFIPPSELRMSRDDLRQLVELERDERPACCNMPFEVRYINGCLTDGENTMVITEVSPEYWGELGEMLQKCPGCCDLDVSSCSSGRKTPRDFVRPLPFSRCTFDNPAKES